MVEPGPAEDGGIPSKIFCRLEHTLSLYLSLLSLDDQFNFSKPLHTMDEVEADRLHRVWPLGTYATAPTDAVACA